MGYGAYNKKWAKRKNDCSEEKKKITWQYDGGSVVYYSHDFIFDYDGNYGDLLFS